MKKSKRKSAEEVDSLLDDWRGFSDEVELEELVASEVTDTSPTTKSHKQPKPRPTSQAGEGVPSEDRSRPTRPTDSASHASDEIRSALKAGHLDVAIQRYRNQKASIPNWELDETDFVALADALHKAQRWSEATPLMEQCLKRFPDSSLRTRVKLAGLYVEVQRRPRAAMKLLKDVSRKTVPEKLLAHYDAITALAKQLIDMSIEDRDPPR